MNCKVLPSAFFPPLVPLVSPIPPMPPVRLIPLTSPMPQTSLIPLTSPKKLPLPIPPTKLIPTIPPIPLIFPLLLLLLLLTLSSKPLPATEHELRLESGLPNYELTPKGWDIEHIRLGVGKIGPSETLEAEFFIPWPENAPGDHEAKNRLLRYALRRVSGMQGLRYPPSSNKAGEILYKEVHLVASPDDLRPLPDPGREEISDRMEMYARTLNDEDTEVVMKIRAQQKERITLQLQNHTPLRFLFVTIVDTGNLAFLMDLSVEPEGVRVYGIGAIRTLRIGLLRRAVRRRLSDTTIAIVTWIEDSIKQELKEWN